MPRAHWGRFEPPEHFVVGHVYDSLGLSLPVGRRTPRNGSLVLAIGVRTRSHALLSRIGRLKPTELIELILPVVLAVLLGALLLGFMLAWLLNAITLPVG